MSTETGAILSQAPEESITILKDYGYNLGIAFQIMDDVLDFAGSEEELGKPIGSDLAQGTLSLPSMLLLERYPKNNPVKKLFGEEPNPEEIRRAIEMVSRSRISPTRMMSGSRAGRTEGRREGSGIAPHLAVADDAVLALVGELHGILDGDDIAVDGVYPHQR
jgi:hypothetical protein